MPKGHYNRKPLSEEHKKKISNGNRGRIHTEEEKLKMKGRVLSVEHRKKIGEANKGRKKPDNFGKKMSGENNWNWIADRTKLAKYSNGNEYRNSPASREWSKIVRDRDKWLCRIADNNCEGRMEAHHILGWTAYPELRYEVNNGITLCHFHHPRKRNDEMRLSPYFQELVKTQ